MCTIILYSVWRKRSQWVLLGKLHYQRWTAQLAMRTLKREEDARMLLIYFPILFWAPESVVHYLSRGFWASLCTRAHAWLFRGCNSTGTLRGRRTGFWSSSSLTPEGRWSTKGTGQSKDNSVRTLYAVAGKKASQTPASPTDKLGSSASPAEAASLDYLLFQYSYFFPWTLQWYWSLQLSKQRENQVATNFEQVQYFIPLNCTDSTYWGGRKRKDRKKTDHT